MQHEGLFLCLANQMPKYQWERSKILFCPQARACKGRPWKQIMQGSHSVKTGFVSGNASVWVTLKALDNGHHSGPSLVTPSHMFFLLRLEVLLVISLVSRTPYLFLLMCYSVNSNCKHNCTYTSAHRHTHTLLSFVTNIS